MWPQLHLDPAAREEVDEHLPSQPEHGQQQREHGDHERGDVEPGEFRSTGC
jgi:hypothetical protein